MKPSSPSNDLESAPPSRPSDETISILERRGYLTEMTPAEESEFFHRFVARFHGRISGPNNYLFMPTYDCNLRCPYCFQDGVRFGPERLHMARVMSREMADRIFSGIGVVEASRHPAPDGHQRTPSFGLFGGEPLLASSRPIVEYIVQRAKSYGASTLSAVTNGTDLGHYEDLLGPEGIGNLQITLDGAPAQHDTRRIYADGSGTFDRIADNVSMALQRGVRISLRVNVDKRNCSDLVTLAEEIVEHGWPGHDRFSVYAAPVRACTEKTDPEDSFGPWELGREIDELKDRYDSMRIVGGPDDHLKNRLRKIFDESSDPMPGFRTGYCGASGGMYVFDPFGDIYACWEQAGDSMSRVGSVEEDGRVTFLEDHDRWRARTVTSNPVCGKCRYALYCGGGCGMRALQEKGTLFENYCETFQRRFRKSVREGFTAHLSGQEVLRQEHLCDL